MDNSDIYKYLFNKYKFQLLFVVALAFAAYFPLFYSRTVREQSEKTAFAKIYFIKRRAKGYVDLYYYFVIDNNDTIKSTWYHFPTKPREFYFQGKFVVKYYTKDPMNNEIFLDKSYQ